MKPILTALALTASLLMIACGGEGALGDSCDVSGDAEECEENSICAKTSSSTDELTCLKVCTDQAQCAADEDCNGVDGSNVKGCRAD